MTVQDAPNNYAQEWEEVWQLFDQEGKEALDLVEEILIKAEADPSNREQIAELFRAMHNFKGMARMMGLSVTESLAHRAEDLIALVRDDGVVLSSLMISLLLEAMDRLRAILNDVLVDRRDVDAATVEDLIERLTAMHGQYAEVAEALPVPDEGGAIFLDEPFFFEVSERPTPPESTLPAEDKSEILSEKAWSGQESRYEHSFQVTPQPIFQKVSETPLPVANEANASVEVESTPPAIERIDPAADPVFVQIFLEMAKDELERLHAGLSLLPTDHETGRQQIETAVDNLRHAANQMGYTRLAGTLDDLTTTLTRPASDTRTIKLSQAELNLFQELTAIEERAQSQHLIERSLDFSPPVSKLQLEKPLSSSVASLLPLSTLNQDSRVEQTLDDLMSTIGELVATHTSLHRAADKLQANDLTETVSGLIKQAAENEEQAQQQLQGVLKPWLENLRMLTQIETEMNAKLNRLHEMTLALRVRPAAEMLNSLSLLAQEIAGRQGKQVEIKVQGAEIELDRGILDLLAQAAQDVITLTTIASLETPAERQQCGKAETGQIWLTLSKQEDHVRLTVTDDGSGLDQSAGKQIAGDELVQWALNGGLGAGKSLDLTPLMAALQARQGQLKLVNQPGKGLKSELYLPLNMVVVDSMVVRAGNVRYVVPVRAIRRIVKPEAQALIFTSADGSRNLLRLENALIPIQTLNGQGTSDTLTDQLLLVIEKNYQVTALAIDELIGQQQVLVRPLEGCLAQIQHISGCAVLGEGEVGLVLSLH